MKKFFKLMLMSLLSVVISVSVFAKNNIVLSLISLFA